MKALSVKQPWASLIAAGHKKTEWRTWQTSYRGELLIVACKSPPNKVLPGLQGVILPLGQALCIVELFDCVWDAEKEKWGWHLRELRPLREPFPVAGKLRLFDVTVPPGSV